MSNACGTGILTDIYIAWNKKEMNLPLKSSQDGDQVEIRRQSHVLKIHFKHSPLLAFMQKYSSSLVTLGLFVSSAVLRSLIKNACYGLQFKWQNIFADQRT